MAGVVVLTQGESVMTWCASSTLHSEAGRFHASTAGWSAAISETTPAVRIPQTIRV
jgi:hypothetical protein